MMKSEIQTCLVSELLDDVRLLANSKLSSSDRGKVKARVLSKALVIDEKLIALRSALEQVHAAYVEEKGEKESIQEAIQSAGIATLVPGDMISGDDLPDVD